MPTKACHLDRSPERSRGTKWRDLATKPMNTIRIPINGISRQARDDKMGSKNVEG
jgi:hypothetical protein